MQQGESTHDTRKRAVAQAALECVHGGIIGVGTGSTANFFIDALAGHRSKVAVAGAVASSEASAQRLRAHGIEVVDLNQVEALDLYVDGADEVNPHRQLIKGGGGALTREKLVAAVARRFVCIVDDSKMVERLGRFPLPVEVIPMARRYVAGRLSGIGARPVERVGFVTDNGNAILDAHGLSIDDPLGLETEINQWAGVVTVGLFARRPADLVLIADGAGVHALD